MTELRKQLYRLSSSRFKLPIYVDDRWRVCESPADNLPIMQWPDGRWCHAANTYLRELFERGLSRRNRGGSITAAAAHITHLVRFCWRARTDFVDLTDNQFAQFITELIKEKRPNRTGEKMRNANTVIAVGRNCLGLLQSVANHHGEPRLVGSSGRIRVQKKEYWVKVAGGREGDGGQCIKRIYLHHASFPPPDAMRRRLPIKSEWIEKIRETIHRVSRTAHQRARRRAMLKILEVTGERRGECAEVMVDAVRKAALMKDPMLQTITLKQSGGKQEYRWVPISSADALSLLEYAQIYRSSVVRSCWGGKDHGYLLVNGRTGAPLRPNTITQEIKRLAKGAGIPSRACPHMFRHRFITKQFVAMIERHHTENVDEFRKLLLSTEKLKQQMLQITGHKNISSLERYIHLAFEEITEYKKTYHHAQATAMLDSFRGTLSDEVNRLREGDSPQKACERLLKLAEALRNDLARTHESHGT